MQDPDLLDNKAVSTGEYFFVLVFSVVSGLILSQVGPFIVSSVFHEKIFQQNAYNPNVELSSLVGLWLGLLGGVWYLAAKSNVSLLKFCRFSFRPNDVVVGIGCGVVLQFLLGYLLYYFMKFFDQNALSEVRKITQVETNSAKGAYFLPLLVAITICAPIVEEIFFRGAVLGFFMQVLDLKKNTINAVLAVLSTSLIFAVFHFEPIEIPGLFLLACVLGYLRVKTNRLGGSILTHAAFNMCAFLIIR